MRSRIFFLFSLIAQYVTAIFDFCSAVFCQTRYFNRLHGGSKSAKEIENIPYDLATKRCRLEVCLPRGNRLRHRHLQAPKLEAIDVDDGRGFLPTGDHDDGSDLALVRSSLFDSAKLGLHTETA